METDEEHNTHERGARRAEEITFSVVPPRKVGAIVGIRNHFLVRVPGNTETPPK
jgi:hypothetical protein